MEITTNGPKWSVQELNDFCNEPYNFFNENAIEQIGIIVNGRPVYYAALIRNGTKNILWTFINSNLTNLEHIALYRAAKKEAQKWADKYGEIFSYINSSMELQKKWTLKMGFKKIFEENNLMLSSLKRERC